MALPFPKSSRRPPRADERAIANRYLTDGRRLFRVVSEFSPGTKAPTALLEDCSTLAVKPYSPTELYEMGLRPVRRDVEGP